MKYEFGAVVEGLTGECEDLGPDINTFLRGAESFLRS
jgi:hypothetical protein